MGAPTSTPVQTISRAQVVERIGDLEAQIESIKAAADLKAEPHCQELNKLKKLAEGWFENSPADQSFTEESQRFILLAGPKALKREIVNPLKLFKLSGLSIQQFLSVFCDIFLGVVDKRIPKDQHHLFLKSEQSGRRTVKVAAKPATQPARAA